MNKFYASLVKFVQCKSSELVWANGYDEFSVALSFQSRSHITQILLRIFFPFWVWLPTVSEVARTRSVSCKWLNSNWGNIVMVAIMKRVSHDLHENVLTCFVFKWIAKAKATLKNQLHI